MPKKAFDYKNSVIYKICCKDHNIKDIYIGSTTNMVKRRNYHKSNCNNEKGRIYHLYVYEFIREHGGWDNWNMILVEKYPCVDKIELEQRERYWYDELKASLNSRRPYRSDEERIKYDIECKKRYYEENKDYYRTYTKDYREKNIDKLKSYNKKWIEENKEKIKAHNGKRYNCECGGKYTHNNKLRHNKTKKHRLYLEKQEHLKSVEIGVI
jgi:hypothetical protein